MNQQPQPPLNNNALPPNNMEKEFLSVKEYQDLENQKRENSNTSLRNFHTMLSIGGVFLALFVWYVKTTAISHSELETAKGAMVTSIKESMSEAIAPLSAQILKLETTLSKTTEKFESQVNSFEKRVSRNEYDLTSKVGLNDLYSFERGYDIRIASMENSLKQVAALGAEIQSLKERILDKYTRTEQGEYSKSVETQISFLEKKISELTLSLQENKKDVEEMKADLELIKNKANSLNYRK